MNIHAATVFVESMASVPAPSDSSQSAWRNFLPQFRREIPASVLDAAWGARLVGTDETWTIDDFPTVKRNGQTVYDQAGQVLTMVQLSLLTVKVGKINAALPAVGEVIVTITDLMGDHYRNLTDGEVILTQGQPFVLLPTSVLEVAFSETAENLCADILLIGAATELAES